MDSPKSTYLCSIFYFFLAMVESYILMFRDNILCSSDVHENGN
jgi:hypothetical protein